MPMLTADTIRRALPLVALLLASGEVSSGEEGLGKWRGRTTKDGTFAQLMADRVAGDDGKPLTRLEPDGQPWVSLLLVVCYAKDQALGVVANTFGDAEPFRLGAGWAPVLLTYDGDGPFGVVSPTISKSLVLQDTRSTHLADGLNFRVSAMQQDGTLMATDEKVLERLLRSKKVVIQWAPKGAQPGMSISSEFDLHGLSEAIRPVQAACARTEPRVGNSARAASVDTAYPVEYLSPRIREAFRELAGEHDLAEKTSADYSVTSARAVYASVRVGQQTASGSGVVISEEGRIVTNYHVVAGGATFEVRFPAAAGAPGLFPARPVSCSEESDLATLAITPTKPLAFARMDDSLPSVGDRVFAIGSPYELEGTLSEGVVSQLRELGGVPLIQTTAQISHGSSGGGLFLPNGSLIGITEMTLSGGQSLNFAVPMSAMATLHPCNRFNAPTPPPGRKKRRKRS